MEELEFITIPRDEEDPNYIKSFDKEDREAALLFFEEFGFVVFRDIFDAEGHITT